MSSFAKTCQNDDNDGCKSAARAFCYHCSRNLCLDHLTQHAQLIDASTRLTLKDYSQRLDTLSESLQSATVSPKILKEPFVKLEQWRTEAYRQIDDMVERKSQEIHMKIDEYRSTFDTMRNELLARVVICKQTLTELSRKRPITSRTMLDLSKSIEQLQNESHALNKHSIKVVSNRPLLRPIHIRMQLDDWKPTAGPSLFSSESLPPIVHQFEFRLKYVRLSGFVTCHYVLVEVNGTVGDLIDRFISTQNESIVGKRKPNYLLLTEICQQRIHRRFTVNVHVKAIFNKVSELVLYETPFELSAANLQQYCLVLCRFEDGLPWNIKFGLPVLLNVPRFQCRGRDAIRSLGKVLQMYFPLLAVDESSIRYEIRIAVDDHPTNTTVTLNESSEQTIDDHLSMIDNTMRIVDLAIGQQLPADRQSTRFDQLHKLIAGDEQS